MSAYPIITCTLSLALLLPAAPASHLSTQNPPEKQAETEPAPPDDNILRGPDVEDRGLVRIDFRGRFEPVQGRPILAAIALLDDPQLSEAARKAADNRLVELSDFLLDEIELIRDATDAQRERDRKRARKLYHQLWDRFDPDHTRDPLLHTLESKMSDEQLTTVSNLLDDYWNTFYEWELQDAKKQDDTAWAEIRNALSFDQFQRELQQAYRISLQPIAATLERVYAAADVDEEQKHIIRDIVIDYVKEFGNQPSADARVDVSMKIFDSLTPDQRRRFLDALIWDS